VQKYRKSVSRGKKERRTNSVKGEGETNFCDFGGQNWVGSKLTVTPGGGGVSSGWQDGAGRMGGPFIREVGETR